MSGRVKEVVVCKIDTKFVITGRVKKISRYNQIYSATFSGVSLPTIERHSTEMLVNG